VHRKQLSFDGVDGDVVKRIVGFLPNMAGASGINDIFLSKKTADAARCLFDLQGSSGVGKAGGEVGKANWKHSVCGASRAR